jgi:adenylosuccinate synthase
MVTARPAWDALSSHDHNQWGEWQGSFRSGPLDLVVTRYALAVLGGVDGLVLTNLDRLSLLGARVPLCVGYEGAEDLALFDAAGDLRVVRPFELEHQTRLGEALARARPRFAEVRRERYADEVAARVGVRLAATSAGPRAEDKAWRSEWGGSANALRCRMGSRDETPGRAPEGLRRC